MARAAQRGAPRTLRTVRLKPADPFELIRWLARSQSDPRKAVAELVQNSLDAGARQVAIERLRRGGNVTLVIRDDGEGVVPELSREEALAHIATHIGHSRKLGLDPGERMERVIAGKYGVGLLGFWSIGKRMEIRSRVNGEAPLALRLEEDSPNADIVGVPLRTDAAPTYTEVVIAPVHETAQKVLSGRRLADYLAAELRGQLLASRAKVEIHDRVARGLAQKHFVVAPRRFTGERLELPEQLEVPGHPPLRVELYLARGAERPSVEVACAGTLVADDLADLGALGLGEPPWVGRELSGLLDFAGFTVPPGTRRGVVPDAAAVRFVGAVERLRPLVEAELERLDAERRAARDRDVVRELSRALRGLRRRLPQYDLPAVESGREGGPAPGGNGAGTALPEPHPETPEPELEPLPLLPPGPLARVRIAPSPIALAAGTERRVSAVAQDDHGERVADARFEWSLEPSSGAASVTIRGDGARPALVAAPAAPLGAAGTLRVVATQSERSASASAEVLIAELDERGSGLGVPEPRLVSDAEGGWRSRLLGSVWEVNDAHEDYVALRDDSRARLRYLLSLLAKEIVLRTTGRTDAGDVIDAVIQILAHAERNLRRGS